MNSPGSSVIRDSITTPLVICYSLLLKMAIGIVALPMKNGGSFHRFWYVYQRLNHARNLGREVSDVMGVPQSWSKSLGYGFSYWNNDADDQGSHDWRKPSESHDMPMNSPLVGGWATQPLWKIMDRKKSVGIFWNSQLKKWESHNPFHGSSRHQPGHKVAFFLAVPYLKNNSLWQCHPRSDHEHLQRPPLMRLQLLELLLVATFIRMQPAPERSTSIGCGAQKRLTHTLW